MSGGKFRWLRALVAFVITGGCALPLLYGIAVTVSPPRTSDGHPVMPIGQAGFAMIGAPIAAAAVAYAIGRAPNRPF